MKNEKSLKRYSVEKAIAGSAALRGVAMHQDVSGALGGRCSYARAGCRRMAESRGSKPASSRLWEFNHGAAT
jgi:hypothetical protein